MLNRKSLVIFIQVLVVTANICILYYVVDMEKQNCHCSESWLRDYIKVVSSILIIMIVAGFVVPSLQQMIMTAVKKNKLLIVPLIAWNIVAILYLGVLLTYYYRLTKNNCQCSEDWKRKILLYPIIVLVPLVVSLSILFGIKAVKALKK